MKEIISIKVRCIEEGQYNIREGSIYDVTYDKTNPDFYTIINDFGYRHYAKVSNFECISISRNKKLELLGI
jgi:hypothetical protein